MNKTCSHCTNNTITISCRTVHIFLDTIQKIFITFQQQDLLSSFERKKIQFKSNSIPHIHKQYHSASSPKLYFFFIRLMVLYNLMLHNGESRVRLVYAETILHWRHTILHHQQPKSQEKKPRLSYDFLTKYRDLKDIALHILHWCNKDINGSSLYIAAFMHWPDNIFFFFCHVASILLLFLLLLFYTAIV